jgi:plastocyanin
MSGRGVGYAGLLAAALALGLALTAAADQGNIVITIKDGKFAPSEVPFPAGQKVKLIVRNQDKTTSEFESTDFHREKVVQSGDEITLFVGPLDAGTYEFFDDFHPEDRGHLVVK